MIPLDVVARVMRKWLCLARSPLDLTNPEVEEAWQDVSSDLSDTDWVSYPPRHFAYEALHNTE